MPGRKLVTTARRGKPRWDNAELVQEVSDFRITYLLDNHRVAGIMNLRQPIAPPVSFGPRPSLSFFLYNQDGQQAIARPYLDAVPATGFPGASPLQAPDSMPKYHPLDNWDAGTRAPIGNFVYDFACFPFLVDDSWRQVYTHDESGNPLSGDGNSLPHELFVHIGPRYFNTEQRLFCTGSQPLVRVQPAVPLRYESHNWGFRLARAPLGRLYGIPSLRSLHATIQRPQKPPRPALVGAVMEALPAASAVHWLHCGVRLRVHPSAGRA